MKIILQPPGAPGVHLGVSHTRKHYLRVPEMWDDVAVSVPDDARPLAVLRLAGGLPDEVTHRDLLLRTYQHGYGAVVKRLAADVEDPDGSPEWVGLPAARQRKGRHVGEGVILVVRRQQDRWRMHTAYRPARFKLKHPERVPRDEQSVDLRRKMASCFAEQRVAVWRRREEA